MIRLILIASSSVRALYPFAATGPGMGLEALMEAAVAVLSGEPSYTRSPVEAAASPRPTISSIVGRAGSSATTRATDAAAAMSRPMKRRRTAGEDDLRGRSVDTLTPRPVSDVIPLRRRIITDFLIANNRTRDNDTFNKLREIFRNDSMSDKTLQVAIQSCCRELGIALRPRTSTFELSRRMAIVEKFVGANRDMLNSEMAPLIRDLMPTGDRPEELEPEYFLPLISRARRKLQLAARRDFRSVVPADAHPSASSSCSPRAKKPGEMSVLAGDVGVVGPERRREIITKVLIETNKTGDTRAFRQVREILGNNPVADKTLYCEIDRCRKDLGLKTMHYVPRLSKDLQEKRTKIVESFIQSNPQVRNVHLVPRVNEALQTVGIPEVEFKILCNMMSTARKKLNIPRRSDLDDGLVHAPRTQTGAPADKRAATLRAATAIRSQSRRTTTTAVPLIATGDSDEEYSDSDVV